MYVAPSLSVKARPVLNMFGNLVLYAFMAIILFKMRSSLKNITPWVVAAALLMAVGSLALVHLLVKADELRERTLSICNTNRHVGLALLLSGHYLHSKNSLPTVACYALVAPFIMVLYSKYFRPQPDALQERTAAVLK